MSKKDILVAQQIQNHRNLSYKDVFANSAQVLVEVLKSLNIEADVFSNYARQGNKHLHVLKVSVPEQYIKKEEANNESVNSDNAS